MPPLELLPPPDDHPAPSGTTTDGPRILVSGAPVSPGPLPVELASHLRHGEVLVWWGDKDTIHFGPVLMVFGAVLAILAFVSALAPEFWLQPPVELAKALSALLSPALLVLVRERLNQRTVIVTDTAVLDIDRSGESARIPIDRVQRVSRDLLRGGLRLQAGNAKVLIPPPLADDTRRAIASQVRGRVRSEAIDDPQGWMP